MAENNSDSTNNPKPIFIGGFSFLNANYDDPSDAQWVVEEYPLDWSVGSQSKIKVYTESDSTSSFLLIDPSVAGVTTTSNGTLYLDVTANFTPSETITAPKRARKDINEIWSEVYERLEI